MPGTSWLKHTKTPPFMPEPHRALLPRSAEKYTRALPLRWETAFPEKAVLPEDAEPRKQWEAAVLTVRWQAWAYGVLVLAGYRVWGMDGGPIRSPGRWWGGAKRWSLGSL